MTSSIQGRLYLLTDIMPMILEKQGCNHRMEFWENVAELEYCYSHGSNPEAVLIIPVWELRGLQSVMRRVFLFHIKACRRQRDGP